jgi:DNA-binding Xre family transcriptional regulator
MVMTVAENVKKAIQDKGLKQSYVAESIGLTGNQLSAILCGRMIFRLELLSELCKVLDCTPNDLMMDAPREEAAG